MTDCIFCNIVSGDIPSIKIYEDDHVLAFLDITQVTQGHTLVIPKEHYSDWSQMPENASSQLAAPLPKISRQLQEQLGAKGMNIISNIQPIAGQSVFHTHIHLLPRYDEEDGLHIDYTVNQPEIGDLMELAEKIKGGQVE